MKGLVKVAPIVVILACAASLFFAFKVSGIKKGLQDDKAQLEGNLKSTNDKLAKAQGDLSDTQTKLTEAQNEVVNAKAKLGGVEVELAQKKREADDLATAKKEIEEQLAGTKTQLAEAQEALKPLQEKVNALAAQDVEELTKKVEAMTKENEVLAEKVKASTEQVAQLQQEIMDLRETPAGTRGRVALAKDQWNFVVLDIGRNDRVREETDFLLYRDAKLVGKARVTSVNQFNSVAELLPDFKVSAPRAGDIAVISKQM